MCLQERKLEADLMQYESFVAYRFDVPICFFETVKISRFTVGFGTPDHTKWVDLANTKGSDDVGC